MMTVDAPQGSKEWYAARCGSVGASQIADVCAKLKSGGYGASRTNLMAQLLCERLTKVPTEGYVNSAMQWGIDHEPEARCAYEFYADVNVTQVGLVKHPSLPFTHASPDGLIADDGAVEIKCPQTAAHMEVLLSESVPGNYILQMQWQMNVAERKWCDFVSYDPRMPANMRLFVKRVYRDDTKIAELEREVRSFLAELAQKFVALTTKYDAPRESA